jgi:hypothetical protein
MVPRPGGTITARNAGEVSSVCGRRRRGRLRRPRTAVVERCFARHCGLDASRERGAPQGSLARRQWAHPWMHRPGCHQRAPALTAPDGNRRGRGQFTSVPPWRMGGGPCGALQPRTAANLSLDASTRDQTMCTTSDLARRGRWRCIEDALGAATEASATNRGPRYAITDTG